MTTDSAPPAGAEGPRTRPSEPTVEAELAELAELAALRAKVARVEAEIADEEEYRRDCPATEITIFVPHQAGDALTDRIFDAVADAAHDAQPEDREGWDVFVSATKRPSGAVPVHLLRRALDG